MPNWSSNTLIGKADPSNPESEDIATPPAGDEVIFIDGVGAGRNNIKSCRDGVQWVRVGNRIYWPLSDSDAKRLQSACCGNGSFDGPTTPAGDCARVTEAVLREARCVVSYLDHASMDTTRLPGAMGAALRRLRKSLDALAARVGGAS